MLSDSSGAGPHSERSEKRSIVRHPLLYSSCILAMAALYAGWIVFSRWHENREIERRSEQERAEKQREADRAVVEQMGGKEFAIQMFYASPKSIKRGQSAELCYGVANAKSVKLEPQENPVWPSPSRCVDVSPARTTTYTLTIEDGTGRTQSQSVELQVR